MLKRRVDKHIMNLSDLSDNITSTISYIIKKAFCVLQNILYYIHLSTSVWKMQGVIKLCIKKGYFIGV
jgi:hypothetical protein